MNVSLSVSLTENINMKMSDMIIYIMKRIYRYLISNLTKKKIFLRHKILYTASCPT